MRPTLIALGIWIMAMTSFGQAVHTFDTIASMTNTPPNQISGTGNKATIIVRGYYSANDGGGGDFYYDSTNTLPVDNGLIFPSKGSGRYARIWDGVELSVLMFGAQRNSTNDSTAAVQAAINAVAGTYPIVPSGGVVRFPSGYIQLTHDIVVPATVRLVGESPLYSSFLQFNSGSVITNAGVYFVESNAFQLSQGSGMENLEVRMNGAAGNGILIRSPYDNVRFINVALKDAGTNFYAFRATTNLLDAHLGQGLFMESCYFSRFQPGSQIPLVILEKQHEWAISDTKMFGEGATNNPTARVVLELNGCRGGRISGGGIAEADIGIRILSDIQTTIDIDIQDSVTFESIRDFVVAGGTFNSAFLNLGNFRYQFGVAPDNYFIGTNTSFSTFQDLTGTGISLYGTNSLRNWVVSGLIGSVTNANPGKNLVQYVGNSVHYPGMESPVLSIGTNTPSFRLWLPGLSTISTNMPGLYWGAATNSGSPPTNWIDNGLQLRHTDGTAALTVDNTRTTIRQALRVNSSSSTPNVSFFITDRTETPGLFWAASSSVNNGLQLRYDGSTSNAIAGITDVTSPPHTGFQIRLWDSGILESMRFSTNGNIFYARNLNLGGLILAGGGIALSTNGATGALTISATGGGGGGPTNGTAMYVDSAGPQTVVNFVDNAETDPSISGTNLTVSLKNGSIGTNRIDSTFYSLLMQTNSGSGTIVTVDGGADQSRVNFADGSEISQTLTGTNNVASLIDGSINTNRISSAFYTWLLSLSGGGADGVGGLYGNGVFKTNWNLRSSANATVSAVNVTNLEVTFTGVGSATNGYLLKSATILTNLNNSAETYVWDFNLPANTLSEDGDELEFYTSGRFLNNSGGTAGYTWRFYADGGVSPIVSGNLDSAFPDISSDKSVQWRMRLRRLSNTNAFLIVDHLVGDANGSTTTNDFAAQLRKVTPPFAVVGFDGAVNFQFTVDNTSANANLGHTLYGYTVLKLGSAGGSGGSGTVTSVALSPPNFQSVSGSPITSSGTLSLSWSNQNANQIFAGPTSGGAAAPTFRQMADGDIPSDITRDSEAAATYQPLNTNLTQISAAITTSGQMYIRDPSGVVTNISTTGSGNVMRTRTGVARTVPIAANWFNAEATEPATAATNSWATTTDRSQQECWKFSATSTNGVQGYFVYPMSWDAGTLNVKLYWKQVTAEANTTNVWSIALGSASDNDTMGNILGTRVEVLDQGLNDTNKIAVTSWSSAITPGNSGAAGDAGTISIRRLPGHASDNMTVETYLLRVLLEYTETAAEPTDN